MTTPESTPTSTDTTPSPAVTEVAQSTPGPKRRSKDTEEVLDVLVVEDDQNQRHQLASALELLGCTVVTAVTANDALTCCNDDWFDLAFCDLQLGEELALDLIPKLLAANPNLQVVVLTAFATVDTAVEAIRLGAANYLSKPFTVTQLRGIVDGMREESARIRRMTSFERDSASTLQLIQSNSQAMQACLQIITRSAKANVSVLMRGEHGTGKTVLAHLLHKRSSRSNKPFVTINCPSLGEELMASELFGHAKGSFTGAIKDQPGKFELADGGTIFLDELGDLSPGIQAKLLRFLQEHRYERVGETESRSADVRIVAATNRDLEQLVKEGTFREDLLFRINAIEVVMPPLRERREDILALAQLFLAEFAEGSGSPVGEFSTEAVNILMNYEWPGNIRELRNEMQRVAVLWPSRVVRPEAFSHRLAPKSAPNFVVGSAVTLAELEREHIRKVLQNCDTFEQAASVLGIESSTLWRKRRRLDL
jgi:two-component system, NtrC family, response regulator AlgB